MLAVSRSCRRPCAAAVCVRAASFKARRQKAQSSVTTDATRKQQKRVQDFETKKLRQSGNMLENRGQKQKSLNMIVEDYIPDAATSPASIITVAGWKDRYGMLRKWGSSMWSKYVVLPSNLDGFSRVGTAKECQDIYKAINEAIPKNDKQVLTDLTTPAMNQMLRSQFEQTFSAGHTIKWEMRGELAAPSIHHARAFAMTTDKNYWAQLTIKLVTKQVVCIYDRKGKLVFGHPEHSKRVTEYPCFERHITEPSSKWRLCGKLAIDDSRRKNGLVPLDPVVQAAMDGKSIEEQSKILKETRKSEDAEFRAASQNNKAAS